MKGMALAAVCVLALSGCVREVMDEEAGVVKIAFSASPTATRTEFQNPVSPSGITKEHVYWRNGDAVAVCSDLAANQAGTSHNAVYTVSASSENLTEVPATSADGLRWADKTSVHKFFAVYGSGATVNMTKMVGTMPAAQTLTWNEAKTVGKAPMAYAFMVSTKESVKVDALEMKFNQMYTAFQFTVGSGDNDAVSLTSFTLSSTSAALAGGFEVDYNATTPTAISRATDAEPTKSITVTFPKTGDADFQVVKNAPVTFTVLALAQPLETMTNLSIEFTGPVIGTRKLDLKRNDRSFITFAPGTKHIINGLSFPNLLTATGEDIIWEQTAIGEDIAWLDDSYVLGVRDPYDLTYKGGRSETGGVISYRIVDGNPVAAEWTVVGYYDTREAAENAPSDDPSHRDLPSWIKENGYPNSGEGAASTSGQSVLIYYKESTPSQTEKTITYQKINDEIASSTFGLGSSPDCYFNLAYPENKLSDKIIESANSYVINGPGYYRIPMVMGNGVKRNALNTASYTRVVGAHTGSFKNHVDEVVSNPLLQKSNGTDNAYTLASAYVVWESTDGLIEVTGSDYQLVPVQNNSPFTKTEGTLNGTMDESNTTGGQDVYWLNFHVAKGEQGNAVIAVTDGSNVLWSYHIWVTNYVSRNEVGSEDKLIKLNPNRTTFISFEGKQNTWYTLMPLNLGWLYGEENIKAIEYASNAMYVKILQEGSNKTTVMEVKRPGHHVVTKYGLGNAPFYQWGRKDPFMPTDEVGGGTASEYVKAYTATGVSFGTAIQHPESFYYTQSETTAWIRNVDNSNVTFPANAWNASIDTYASDMSTTSTGTINNSALNDYIRNHPVVKTIYDPCPAGYSVPTYGAFSFRTDDLTVATNVNYSATSGWATPTNVPFGTGRYYGQSEFRPNIYMINSFEDFKPIMGIKDGIENNSFNGYGFYTETEVTYRRSSNNQFDIPTKIEVGGSYLFFPALGFRSYHSGVFQWKDTGETHQYGRRGYYWSDMAHDSWNGRAFDIEHYWNSSDGVNGSHYFNVKNWSNWPVGDGCYIRPMQNDN